MRTTHKHSGLSHEAEIRLMQSAIARLANEGHVLREVLREVAQARTAVEARRLALAVLEPT